MRIIVTGGTGFLGRHVVDRLAADGHAVVFTGRDRRAAEGIMAEAGSGVLFQPLIHGMPQAGACLAEVCTDADAVVHCAALSAPWGRSRDFHDANIASAREVINACHRGGVDRLVHISTPSLYACRADRLNITEDEPLPKPVNEYARTKLEAEHLVHGAGIPQTVILRPRAIFGPWDKTLLPRLLRILSKGVLPRVRGALAMSDVTYVSNVVDAVVAALHVSVPRPHPVYNITNGEPMPLGALFELMAAEFGLKVRPLTVPRTLLYSVGAACEGLACLTGREPVLTRYSAGVLTWSQTLDISAARRELGYAPRVGVREGLRAYAAWWREHAA